jgi:hypothetical protein
MNITELASLKPQFVSREVGNELILVPLTGNIAQMNEMFSLNETGKTIWENMDQVESLEQLKQIVLDNFEIDNETAENDIEKFLVQLERILKRK